MIDRGLHPEPDTKNPSNDRKGPEGFFTDSPVSIDRIELVDAHEDIGEYIDPEKRI
jgi:hypothetical protein